MGKFCKERIGIVKKNPCITIDETKCIKCGKCKSVCAYSEIYKSKNTFSESLDCNFCEQCFNICPTGAISIKSFNKQIKSLFTNKNKIVCIVIDSQFFERVKSYLKLDNSFTINHLITLLKQVGFKYVYNKSIAMQLQLLDHAISVIKLLENKERFVKKITSCPAYFEVSEQIESNQYPNLNALIEATIKNYHQVHRSTDASNIHCVIGTNCSAQKITTDTDEYLTILAMEVAELLKELQVDMYNAPQSNFDTLYGLNIEETLYDCHNKYIYLAAQIHYQLTHKPMTVNDIYIDNNYLNKKLTRITYIVNNRPLNFLGIYKDSNTDKLEEQLDPKQNFILSYHCCNSEKISLPAINHLDYINLTIDRIQTKVLTHSSRPILNTLIKNPRLFTDVNQLNIYGEPQILPNIDDHTEYLPAGIRQSLRMIYANQCHEIGIFTALSKYAFNSGYYELSSALKTLANEDSIQAGNCLQLMGDVSATDLQNEIEKRIQFKTISYKIKTDLINVATEYKLDDVVLKLQIMAQQDYDNANALKKLKIRFFGEN